MCACLKCLCDCISSLLVCIKKISAHWVTAFVTFLMAVLITVQLYQLNKLKKFDNFNHFNEIYDSWYDEMPKCLKDESSCEPWEKLSPNDKAWVRRYFNLYTQEYYFEINGMIPDEMWNDLIHGTNGCNGAAIVNLREYSILVEGYYAWKEKGEFQFPEKFTEILDKKIKECRLLPPDRKSSPARKHHK